MSRPLEIAVVETTSKRVARFEAFLSQYTVRLFVCFCVCLLFPLRSGCDTGFCFCNRVRQSNNVEFEHAVCADIAREFIASTGLRSPSSAAATTSSIISAGGGNVAGIGAMPEAMSSSSNATLNDDVKSHLNALIRAFVQRPCAANVCADIIGFVIR